MSVIQTLRGRGSTFALVILVIALVGFLLMDAVQSNISRIFQTDRTMMGEVNGERIETKDYQTQLQEYEDLTKQRSGASSLTDQERTGLQEQLWNDLVNESLLKAEIEKLGVVVTPKEFKDMFTNQQFADATVKQNFTDPNTGIFDPNRVVQYEQQIAQAEDQTQKNQWEKFKESLERQRKYSKYINLIRGGIYTPSFLLDEMAIEQNKFANISYVLAPYTLVDDATIKVTDEEIKTYMKERSGVYTNQNDKASIEYVSFPIIPSSKDSAASLGFLNKILADFEAAEDPEQFASNNSDELVDEGFHNEFNMGNANAAVLVAANVGTIVGPYYDNEAYKLSKILEKKMIPDSVKASHILISINEGRNEAQAKASIDSIEAQIKAGANFAQIASVRSEDQGSAKKGGDLGYFGQGVMVKEFNKFCFNGKKGEMEIVKTQYGYHLIKIDDQISFKTNVKLATIAKSMAPSQETINTAFSLASKFKTGATNEATFKEQAKKLGMDKRIAQDLTPTQALVQGMGNVRSLVRWAFESEVGDISSVISYDNQCVVARVTSKTKKGDLADINSVKAEIEAVIKRKKKAEQLAAKAKGQTNLATIATIFNTEVKNADSVRMLGYASNEFGYEPRVSGAAMNPKLVNKVSDGIAGEQGVFFIMVRSVIDNSKNATRIPQLERAQVEAQFMQGVEQLIPAVLKKKATIIDNRNTFY